MNFADNLKALRKEKGLTQEELSCATGISVHSINSYESGRRVPNAKTMLTLARYFQVSGDFLLGKTVNREDPFKWRDFENMETVKDAITGLFHRLLDSTRSSSDHNQKMVFDILVELRHLLISDNLTEAQMAAALDLLQMVLGISTRFIDTCSASVASSELSRLTRSVDACTEQYQKALTTAAAAFNASILTLPTPMEEIAIYDLPASAGTGQFLDSQDFSMMEFPVDIIPRGTSFGVRVSGSSMLPTIQDGEVVFLKRQSFLEDGDIGVFILNGDAYCKRYRSVGGVRLESDNHAAYPPLEVGESDDLRILGKVIGHVYP